MPLTRSTALLLTVLLALLCASTARSGVTLRIEEVGADVVMTGAGTYDLSEATLFAEDVSVGGTVLPSAFFITGAPGDLVDVYDLPASFSGPVDIGPGLASTAGDSGTGHAFGINFGLQRIGHRVNESSFRPHNGSTTWLSQSLAGLGITPGSYKWTWGSGATADSVTLHALGGACADADGDGYGSVGHVDCPGGLDADCDDANPLIHPGAADVCDGVDNDCVDGADQSNVCSAAFIDGTVVTLEIESDKFGVVETLVFPVTLGAPEATGASTGFGLDFDIDVEGDFVTITAHNVTGGKGNVAGTARLTGLQWVDLDTHVVAASVSSDFDYVYASKPTPFPAPGTAEIIDDGHGVSIYFDELLFQNGESHTTTVRFAAAEVAHVHVPLATAPAIAALIGVMGALGVAAQRRKAIVE